MNAEINRHIITLLAITLAASPGANAQNVVYVNPIAPGANDGTTWNDAYTDLQYALTTETSPRDFWVAQGTYSPGGNRTDTFLLQPEDRLFGGFAGGENSLEERDWEENVTRLSGELGSQGPGDNIFVIVTITNGGQFIVVDGFVVEYADRHAFHIVNSRPKLANLKVRNNANQDVDGTGAAIQIEEASSAIVQDCEFPNNTAYQGGAVRVEDTFTFPEFSRCAFTSNSAVLGGAIAVVELAKPRLSQCSFGSNHASSFGGAVYLAAASAVVLDSAFTGNEAEAAGSGPPARGGAIYADTLVEGGEGLEVRRCVFFKNSASSVDAEAAGGCGGAI